MHYQLEKAREATDAANIRASYAEMLTSVLTDDYDATNDAKKYTVELTQTKSGWSDNSIKEGLEKSMSLTGNPSSKGTAVLTYDSTKEGKAAVTVTFNAASTTTQP